MTREEERGGGLTREEEEVGVDEGGSRSVNRGVGELSIEVIVVRISILWAIDVSLPGGFRVMSTSVLGGLGS